MIIARHCSSSMQHCSTAAGWSKLPPIITASEEWRHTSWSWSHKVALTCTDLIWAHIYSFRQANIHLKLRHLGYKTTKIANSEWLETITVLYCIYVCRYFLLLAELWRSVQRLTSNVDCNQCMPIIWLRNRSLRIRWGWVANGRVFSCKMTPGWMESIIPYAVNVAINPI